MRWADVSRLRVAAVVLSAFCTGCGGPAALGSPSTEVASGDLLEQLMTIYQAPPSDEQQAILDRAESRGEMTLADVVEAQDATFDCFDSNGIESWSAWSTRPDGLPMRDYFYVESPSLTFEEFERITTSCMEENSLYVETIYQMQPAALEREEAFFAERRPLIVACLSDNGVTVDDDATRDEVIQAAVFLMLDEERVGGVEEASTQYDLPPSGPDCLSPYLGSP